MFSIFFFLSSFVSGDPQIQCWQGFNSMHEYSNSTVYSFCVASEPNWLKRDGLCFSLNCPKYWKNRGPLAQAQDFFNTHPPDYPILLLQWPCHFEQTCCQLLTARGSSSEWASNSCRQDTLLVLSFFIKSLFQFVCNLSLDQLFSTTSTINSVCQWKTAGICCWIVMRLSGYNSYSQLLFLL